jgi:hypothetical protein
MQVSALKKKEERLANKGDIPVCPAWIDTDLLAHFGDRNTEPYWKVADALPRASLHTLIQAVDTCVTDTLKSGQSEQKKSNQIVERRVDLGATLLVLPDGVHDFPRPPVFGKRRTLLALLYHLLFFLVP